MIPSDAITSKKQTLENIHVEDIWRKKMKSAGWSEKANKS